MKKDIIFIISLGIIFVIVLPLFISKKSESDFLAYWSAPHLFVHGGNPYNSAEMGALQNQIDPVRFSSTGLISSWNPPWLILILLPICLLPYPIANQFWIFCNTFLIGVALLITWKLCMGDQKSRGILYVYLAGFLFVETITYLVIGQITSLVLLAIMLVIWFLKHDMDVLAGISLLLTTIKPHISYFFIILVLIWVFQNRRWKVLVGFISTILISMVVFWIVIPSWLNDYIFLVSNLPFNQLYTSTVGSFIFRKFYISIFQYSALLLIFAIKPIMQIVTKEGLLTATNLALLFSIPLSPYGFNFDQIVLLPAIVQLISWSSLREFSRKTTILIAIVLIIINIIIALMSSINGLEYYWFFWIPIPVLGIYLLALKMKNASQKSNN